MPPVAPIPKFTTILLTCLNTCLLINTSTAAEPPHSQAIEEVKVTAHRPVQFLINEIGEAEQQMFELFNKLDIPDEFRVVCRQVIVTGSKISSRECAPVYMDRLRKQNSNDFLYLGTPLREEEQLWAENQHKHAAFNAEMRAQALEHPELTEAMLELAAKKSNLKEVMENERQETKGVLGRLFSKQRRGDSQ